MMIKILLVGAGRLGSSILDSFKTHRDFQIYVIDPAVGGKSSHDNFDYADHLQNLPPSFVPDVVLFVVKPQQAAQVLPSYSRFAGPNCLFISVMAGLSLSVLHELTGDKAHWVRAMPNLAARVGLSSTVAVRTETLSEAECHRAELILSSFGSVHWTTQESDLAITTPLSGSSPALFFSICQSFIDSAVQSGIDPNQAFELIVETLKGCAHLLDFEKNNGKQPKDLVNEIASPGGVTLEMLKVFSNCQVDQIIQDAMTAGEKRCLELDLINSTQS